MKKSYVIFFIAFLGLLAFPPHSAWSETIPEDVIVFRVRGQEYTVQNDMIAKVRTDWNARKSEVEQAWKNAVDGTNTWKEEVCAFGKCITLWSYTVTTSASVTLPDFPSFTVERGLVSESLTFESQLPVSWSVKVRGTHDSVKVDANFVTNLRIKGKIELNREGQEYYISINDISGSSSTNTDGSIKFTAIGIPFTWSYLDALAKWGVDLIVKAKMDEELTKDIDPQDGTPDVKKPYYIAQYLPVEALLFPVYSYLSEKGKISYSFSTDNGTPVLELVFGSPIARSWYAEKGHHPRLLYTAEERPSIVAKKESNFQGWYSTIKTIAGKETDFTVSDQDIVSRADWSIEIRNAQIAASAALVYDLENGRDYLYKALKVLFRFRNKIGDPLFTEQWGLKSLYTTEILTSLCQTYDLILGRGFPHVITRDEILQNRIGLPTKQWLIVAGYASVYKMETARQKLKYFIDTKFKKLRDLTYLQTHIWDLLPNLNIAIRNAGALGMSAILFNQDHDAYENISLAMSVIWKKLGLASSVPFDDYSQFTKLSEGEGYSEGSGYLNYAAELYLPFMWAYNKFMSTEAPQQTFIYNDWINQYNVAIPNMLTSERVQKIHEWSLKILLPDGSRPDVKDANKGTVFYSGLLANATSTADPLLRNVWAWDFIENNYPVGRRLIDNFVAFDDILINSQNDPGTIYGSPTIILPEAGNVVFRSGWDSNAVYMHLLADHNWQGTDIVGGMRYPAHQQEDNTSFLIYAYGNSLAMDSGYGHATVSDLVSMAENHNIVLVDGVGPSKTTEAFINNHLDTNFIDFGEVVTSYQNTDISRHVLFINNRYFVVVDELISDVLHRYDWKLHGNGQYSCVSGGHLWTTPNGHKLLAHVTNTSNNGVDIFDINNKSPHFSMSTQNPEEISYHTSIAARENSASHLKYVATLIPSDGMVSLPIITDISDGSSLTAIKLIFDDYTDIIIVTNSSDGVNTSYTLGSSYTGIHDVTSDAQLLFIRISNAEKNLIGVFGQSVSNLIYDSISYVSAPSDIIVQQDSDHDGLMDDYERELGTDPFNPDTDFDGVDDGKDIFPLDSSRWTHDITPMIELLLLGPVASTTVIGRDQVGFDITLIYDPTLETCGCTPENDFVGKFSFEATLKNKSSTPLSGLMVEVTDLENIENGKRENRLILPDGNMGGVGAMFPIPRKDEYLDGVLRKGESVTVHFDICLGSWKPFLFYVNVLGIVE